MERSFIRIYKSYQAKDFQELLDASNQLFRAKMIKLFAPPQGAWKFSGWTEFASRYRNINHYWYVHKLSTGRKIYITWDIQLDF